ncbi:MAG: hypothetical protein M3076_05955, partial [Actinomycetota bacterium]|nr:hypothetical protein [Actinomycetota bacterium]
RSNISRLRRFRNMITRLSIKRATALALALGAVTTVPASAMPIGEAHVTSPASAPQTTVVLGGGAQLTPRLAHAYGERLSGVSSRPGQGFTPHRRIVTAASSESGFNWGDAGIGAAGGLALTVLVLGGAAATTRRRPRHAAGGLVESAAQ